MSNEILRVQNVSKSFSSGQERLEIIKNISFTIEEKTKVCITGSSGCGKSTFLNLIGGLDLADSGEIFAGEFAVHNLNEKKASKYRNEFLGLIFQFHYLLKDFSALENVMMPALIKGKNKNEIKERAEMLLNDVKLSERAEHFPYQLSGGERQRVAVARALMNNPKLILADEPTGNLDPTNARIVQELLFSIVDQHDTTLLLVTHDMNIAQRADLHYTLEGGELIAV